jgi:hypothetical protein
LAGGGRAAGEGNRGVLMPFIVILVVAVEFAGAHHVPVAGDAREEASLQDIFPANKEKYRDRLAAYSSRSEAQFEPDLQKVAIAA